MYNYNVYVSLIDNEVPSSCVEMNYYEETPSDETYQYRYNYGDFVDYIEYYEGCYEKGGRLVYERKMTHFGTCSAKIPCSLITSEDTLINIYEYICV